MNRWLYRFRRLFEQLWVVVGLYGLAGGLLALAAVFLTPLVSEEAAARFGKFQAVEALLTILASSLLAVSTFALGAMVSAYAAVGSGATPRATALVVTDPRTQRALATFIGGFLFSIVALVAVEASYYGPEGRAIVYFGTLAVVLVLAWTLLSWTDHLGRVGRMSYVLQRVEDEAWSSMRDRIEAPRLGAHPIDPDDRKGFDTIVRAARTGYVQNLDAALLQSVAEREGLTFELACVPGTFVTDDHALVRIKGDSGGDLEASVRRAFTIGAARTFDQDVRFGLIVLGEIAARALSPAVNDPGTAVLVTGIAVRLLKRWGEADHQACEVRHPNLRAPTLASADLVDDILGPVARYGAGDVAASVRLQKALLVLGESPDADLAEAARGLARQSVERSRRVMTLPEDVERVLAAVPEERADLR